MPPILQSERWALTPPFHPCQVQRIVKTCVRFCLTRVTESRHTGGIFSVALSVAGCSRGFTPPLHLAPWRYQARCPAVSGLSSRMGRRDKPAAPAKRSPVLPASHIIRRNENVRTMDHANAGLKVSATRRNPSCEKGDNPAATRACTPWRAPTTSEVFRRRIRRGWGRRGTWPCRIWSLAPSRRPRSRFSC